MHIPESKLPIFIKIITEETPAMVCAPWGMQITPSVQKECVLCSSSVAMDEKNEEPSKALNAVIVCIPCCQTVTEIVRDVDGETDYKSMIGGKLMSVQEGMRLTDVMARRN